VSLEGIGATASFQTDSEMCHIFDNETNLSLSTIIIVGSELKHSYIVVVGPVQRSIDRDLKVVGGAGSVIL
jgi:hypothetical protein